MHERMDGWINKLRELLDNWMDERMDDQMDGWMNLWIDEGVNK